MVLRSHERFDDGAPEVGGAGFKGDWGITVFEKPQEGACHSR